MATLNVDLRAGEQLSVTGAATITMMAKSGQRARLRVEADDSVKIDVSERNAARDVLSKGIDQKYLSANP